MSSEEKRKDEEEDVDEEDKGADISVHVKTPKEKKTLATKEKMGIKEFKTQISSEFGAPVEQLTLIFAGKILKDQETLASHNIKDQMTIHLVIKTGGEAGANRPVAGSNAASDPPRADPANAPFGVGAMGGLPGMANLGMGSANFMEMQQRMQSEMMSNPDMLRQVMDSPLTQSLMSNPEVMRGLIQSNPQMQQLMDRNPEINHMLNNPDVLRQTMEIARNPAMLQELMRNQDRAMSNLESIPGGQGALQRMYRDIQEPMLNAAQEQFGGGNPFQALSGNNTGNTESSNASGESAQPVPNPWGGGNAGGSGSSPSASSATGASGGSGGAGGSRPSNLSGSSLFTSPMMQSLLQEMTDNPQLMQNMLNAPYTQSMFNTMAQNPDMAASIIGSNPLFQGNPQMQEQMRSMMPAFLQQMQNPAVQGLMGNPDALSAVNQIQQGLQRLRSAAPDLYRTMGMPLVTGAGVNMDTTPPSTATSDSSSSTTTTATATGSSGTTTTTTTTTATPPAGGTPEQQNAFAQLMSQMVNSMAGQGLNNPPEERFSSQLDQLAAMGFVDRQANIQALMATYGDVNAAIDRLLNRPGGQES